MKYQRFAVSLMGTAFLMLLVASGLAEQVEAAPGSTTLTQAVMCEKISDGKAFNQTVIFSIERGSAFCLSDFNPVVESGFIYHRWYRRGESIANIKLALHPPQWSTYSSIRIRESDIGPWRVDITDEDGAVLKTLKFSITR
ncbi:MAG: DUF2914 domain-containing protein [Deltaproteobacteria bacterium]|nr:DUF2914 domain-containing protein [Deltaproteobacteria bacterium]